MTSMGAMLQRLAMVLLALWLTALQFDGPMETLVAAPVVEQAQPSADPTLRRFEREARKSSATDPESHEGLAGNPAVPQQGSPSQSDTNRHDGLGLRQWQHDLAQARAPPVAVI